MKIGFIGLGVMGKPMVGHLIDAGHDVYLHRVKEASADLVGRGGIACDTPALVAAASEVIILMLPDTPDVDAVLFGPSGVAEGMVPGSLVIDMSSISPVATKQFAARIADLGGHYLDAPVSGGEVGAVNASLSIMVGGNETDFHRALPILNLMGKTITRVGEVGDGQTAKVANQIIVGLTIEAVAEALTFAKQAGADPAKVRQAIMGGFASSRILELHGQRMIDETFEPGFRIRLHRKDIGLAVEAAKTLGVSLPSCSLAAQLMDDAMSQGLGELDHSAMILAMKYHGAPRRQND